MVAQLKKVNVRDLFRNEARDFTVWLEDNIDVLNEQLGFNLTVQSREESVGSFNLDILAEDENGEIVAIENQLEKSDHQHLGQIVTYISNLEAKKAIWIVADARNEHVNAVDWLNQTDLVSMYLVKLEAVQVNDSPPAPLFTVILQPSEETSQVGEIKKEHSERHLRRYRFWSELKEKLKPKTRLFSNRKPSKQNWWQTSTGIINGVTFCFVANQDACWVEIYVGTDNPETNDSIFDQLYSRKVEIESEYGHELIWERLDHRKGSKIKHQIDIGIKDTESQWSDIQDRLVDMMVRYEKVMKSELKKVRL